VQISHACRFDEVLATGFFVDRTRAGLFSRPRRIPRAYTCVHIDSPCYRDFIKDMSHRARSVFGASFCRVYRSPFSAITSCRRPLPRRSPFTACTKDTRDATRAAYHFYMRMREKLCRHILSRESTMLSNDIISLLLDAAASSGPRTS